MPGNSGIRRRDFGLAGLLLAGVSSPVWGEDGFRPLFDGVSLKGWQPHTRSRTQVSLGSWKVEHGVLIGGQDPPGLGSYLVSEEAFEDFELKLEAKPDWPADTGILVRTVPAGNIGFQILLDHRPHGGIGGFYGNGLAGFHAYEYAFGAETDSAGRLVRLVAEKPSEPTYRIPLDFAAPAETFLRVWEVGGWNRFRIRSVGELPRLTTWINDEKIAELDTAKVQAPGYDAQKILALIGRSGHIALEVHDNDRMGSDRWGRGMVCRWRNISIKTLSG